MREGVCVVWVFVTRILMYKHVYMCVCVCVCVCVYAPTYIFSKSKTKYFISNIYELLSVWLNIR